MEIAQDVLSSCSAVINVAIIAPRDVAWSRDYDRFELASSRFGSSFSDKKTIWKFGLMRIGKSLNSLGDLC